MVDGFQSGVGFFGEVGELVAWGKQRLVLSVPQLSNLYKVG